MSDDETPAPPMARAQENELALIELRLGLDSLRKAVHRLAVRQECDAISAQDDLDRVHDRVGVVDAAYQDMALAMAAAEERLAWLEEGPAAKRRRK